MGYGFFPVKDILYDGYMKKISVLDAKFNIDRNVDNLEDFSDDTRGYKVVDTANPKYRNGHVIFYGGPGNI